MEISFIYHPVIPDFVAVAASSPEMARLRAVGMNCGCEYTRLHSSMPLCPYSRFDHSLGVSLIVWHFTQDPGQTLAALFHDISTPVFAHVIDFLNGDYMRQESTEAGTREIIARSESIQSVLSDLHLVTEDVCDYHRYPIADNDAPKLAADRLEYSLGNMVSYGFADPQLITELYEDLTVGANEEARPELMFRTAGKALRFSDLAMRCSRLYVSDEDRYAMQALAVLLKDAIKCGTLSLQDLYTTEDAVIRRLCADPVFRKRWDDFRSLSAVISAEEPGPAGRWIRVSSKKRFIDPYVMDQGRASGLSEALRADITEFLAAAQDCWLCGI